MIWVGRAVSVPLGFLFFVFLLLTLILLEINDTFLDPDYYPELLRQENVYEFVLVDLFTSALDEARDKDFSDSDNGLEENPLVTSGLSTQDIVSSINRAVPPEWVQGLVEQSFDQFGHYLTGERDEFEFTVRAGERVPTLVEEGKSLLRKADAYNLLYDEVVTPNVEDSLDFDLPLGIEVTGERLVESIRRVAPPEWVRDQVETVLDELTPYFVGERDAFEINVQLADRVTIALDEIKVLLRKADAYELLYTEVIEPPVLDNLSDVVQLPYGVSVAEDEVVAALRDVAPPEWVQEQVERLVDEVGPYMTGREDTFTFDVSLIENKQRASSVLEDIVDKRLEEAFGSLRQCATAADVQAALSWDFRGLPPCIPPGFQPQELAERFGVDIAGSVRQLVLGSVPNNIRFSDTQLRRALIEAGAAENVNRIDEVRELLIDGWTYTDANLRQDLLIWDEEGPELLDDLRGFLADGWTYTDVDFREDISDGLSSGADGDPVEDFDRARDLFKTARTFRWLVWIPLALLLVSIGFLGGRGWSGRVAWAVAFLVVAAGTVLLIFGPGYNSFAKSGPIYQAFDTTGLDELREEALTDISADETNDFRKTSRLAAGKGFDIVESVVDGFAGGIVNASRNLLIIGLLALGTAIFWPQITRLVERYWPDVKDAATRTIRR